MIQLENQAAEETRQRGLKPDQLAQILRKKKYKEPKGKWTKVEGMHPPTWRLVKSKTKSK
jgi:hypothetical protein